MSLERSVSGSLFRSSHRRGSVKQVLLKISQNLQENTCATVSFLIKLQTYHVETSPLANQWTGFYMIGLQLY